jgi:hypothetical protein
MVGGFFRLTCVIENGLVLTSPLGDVTRGGVTARGGGETERKDGRDPTLLTLLLLLTLATLPLKLDPRVEPPPMVEPPSTEPSNDDPPWKEPSWWIDGLGFR